MLCFKAFILQIQYDNLQLASKTPLVLAQQESNAAAALLQTLLVSDSSAVGSAVHCLVMTTLHVI